MNQPLYHVGQPVAVWTRNMSVIIPKTIVIAVVWRKGGPTKDWNGTPWNSPHGWGYLVADGEYAPDGRRIFFREPCLRPIDPDTEYLDQEQERTV